MYNDLVLYDAPWIKGLEPSLAQPKDSCQRKTIQRRAQTHDNKQLLNFTREREREREREEGGREREGERQRKKQRSPPYTWCSVFEEAIAKSQAAACLQRLPNILGLSLHGF